MNIEPLCQTVFSSFRAKHRLDTYQNVRFKYFVEENLTEVSFSSALSCMSWQPQCGKTNCIKSIIIFVYESFTPTKSSVLVDVKSKAKYVVDIGSHRTFAKTFWLSLKLYLRNYLTFNCKTLRLLRLRRVLKSSFEVVQRTHVEPSSAVVWIALKYQEYL